MLGQERDVVLFAVAVRTAGVSPAHLNLPFLSVGARHAVPERANSTLTLHSKINPTHSLLSSFRTPRSPIQLAAQAEAYATEKLITHSTSRITK